MAKRRALFITFNVFPPFSPLLFFLSFFLSVSWLASSSLDGLSVSEIGKGKIWNWKQVRCGTPEKQRRAVWPKKIQVFALYPLLVKALPPICKVHSGGGTTRLFNCYIKILLSLIFSELEMSPRILFSAGIFSSSLCLFSQPFCSTWPWMVANN